MGYKDIYEIWLKKTSQNKTLNLELESIKDNDKEIEYRFYKSLEFGTAGMRGIIGCGTNMMNEYTVKRATKGLATYISTLGEKAKNKGVVISYDTRKYSQIFAQKTAGVLISHGIKVYMFEEPSPVPMLSYAVRQFKSIAGVMITASHNPKEYNGYKVYGEDGAQMSPEATNKVVEFISQITDYFSVESNAIADFKAHGDISIIGASFDRLYVKTLRKLSLSKKVITTLLISSPSCNVGLTI
jgi:phosphoglucomutase